MDWVQMQLSGHRHFFGVFKMSARLLIAAVESPNTRLDAHQHALDAFDVVAPFLSQSRSVGTSLEIGCEIQHGDPTRASMVRDASSVSWHD